MEITLPIIENILLTIGDRPDESAVYSTSRLQKGLRMIYEEKDLTEEAVGFGVPVLNKGLKTYFPGEVQLTQQTADNNTIVRAVYTINLVEKIRKQGKEQVSNQGVYAVKNFFAAMIRQFRPARGLLTALSSSLRHLLGWETTYEEAEFSTQVKMTYIFKQQTGDIEVEADLSGLQKEYVSEIIIMNEMGANFFDRYYDSSGVKLTGKQIGNWDEVNAERATFASSTQKIAFALPKMPGARMFRGRELIGTRLAWCGFGYSFQPTTAKFNYSVKIERLP